MIKVFYSGYGYALRCETNGHVDLKLANETHDHYKWYFFIDCDIAEHLKHFDGFTIRELHFIDGNLPRGITKGQALNSEFAITSCNKNWHSKIELKRGETEFSDSFNNRLKFIFDDDAPPVQHDAELKVSINQDRDNDCKAWRESENPPLDNMTKMQVHNALIARNRRLWSSGFSGWCRKQKIITFKTGKPKNKDSK